MTPFNNALCQFKHALCYTRKAQVSLPGPQPLFLCSCATLCKACPSLENKTRTGRNYAACLFVVPWLGKPFYEVGAELRLLTVTLSQVRPKDPSYSLQVKWERALCSDTLLASVLASPFLFWLSKRLIYSAESVIQRPWVTVLCQLHCFYNSVFTVEKKSWERPSAKSRRFILFICFLY